MSPVFLQWWIWQNYKFAKVLGMRIHSFISSQSGGIAVKFDHGTRILPLLVKTIRHYIDYIMLGLRTFQGLYQSQLVLDCFTNCSGQVTIAWAIVASAQWMTHMVTVWQN